MLAIAESPVKIAVIATVALVLIACIVAIIRRRYFSEPPGFMEIYGSRKAKEDYFAMIQPRDDLNQLTERQIGKLVSEYVESAGQSEAASQVFHLGERAIPSLLKILADPKSQIRPSGKDVSMFAVSRTERALQALGRFDIPEVVPFLEKLAFHDDYHLRYRAAVTLASFPSTSKLEMISTLIRDPEEHVRTGVFIGLRHAIRENRLPPDLRRSITSLLAAIVVKESECHHIAESPASLLLDLDVQLATKLLATPEVLNATQPGAARTIELLSGKNIPIPDRILAFLLAETDRADIDYKGANLRGEVLKAMAGMGHPEAESLILHTLARTPASHGDTENAKSLMQLNELAAEALCIVMGIRDPIDRVFDRLDEAAKAGRQLEGPLLNVLVVTDLDSEVLNGGFDQYFFNCSGDRAMVAVPALQEIGAMKHAEIARAAISLFGPDGPSPQREQRFRQREGMNGKQVERMGALDKEWYAAGPNLRFLLHTYSAANAAAFR